MPSSSDRCMVGGMVANNAAGARSFGYGSAKAWVEELDVVLADGSAMSLREDTPVPDVFARLHQRLLTGFGEAIRGEWPAVTKNSSGFALADFLQAADPRSLLLGSEGALGIVTATRLRLAAAPLARALIVIALPGHETLPPLIAQARRVGAAACEFFGGRFVEIGGLAKSPELSGFGQSASAGLLMVEVDDASGPGDEAIAGLAAETRGMGLECLVTRDPARHRSIWRLRHAASPAIAALAADGLVSMQFIEDGVVPVDVLPDYLAGLTHILEGERCDAVMFGHAGDGNLHVNPLIDVRREDWKALVRRVLEQTVDLVARLGGTLSGEHGDGRLRSPFQARVWGQRLDAAFRLVKHTLDGDGILNPGVVVARPGQDPLAGLTAERTR